MTFGKWSDIHHAYKELFGLEAKIIHYGSGYPDIEKEIQQYNREHQPVASLLSI